MIEHEALRAYEALDLPGLLGKSNTLKPVSSPPSSDEAEVIAPPPLPPTPSQVPPAGDLTA